MAKIVSFINYKGGIGQNLRQTGNQVSHRGVWICGG
jgi:hypothetical protein